MISVVQHGLQGSEVLRRRFRSLHGQINPNILEVLGVDEVRVVEAGQIVIDGAGGETRLLVTGIVGEVRWLSNGRRQIVALRMPGDILTPMEGENLVALTRARLADAAKLMARLADASEAYGPLRRAWLTATRTDQALLRDQVVRLGRMSAFERMAHLLLEVHERLSQVGLAAGASFHLPLTQEMLSDVVGLSVVHLNRTLQSLRRDGLISSRHGYVTLVDRPRLIAIASYVSRFPTDLHPSMPAPVAARAARAVAEDGRQVSAQGV